jgi:hypothetical protein
MLNKNHFLSEIVFFVLVELTAEDVDDSDSFKEPFEGFLRFLNTPKCTNCKVTPFNVYFTFDSHSLCSDCFLAKSTLFQKNSRVSGVTLNYILSDEKLDQYFIEFATKLESFTNPKTDDELMMDVQRGIVFVS